MFQVLSQEGTNIGLFKENQKTISGSIKLRPSTLGMFSFFSFFVYFLIDCVGRVCLNAPLTRKNSFNGSKWGWRDAKSSPAAVSVCAPVAESLQVIWGRRGWRCQGQTSHDNNSCCCCHRCVHFLLLSVFRPLVFFLFFFFSTLSSSLCVIF